MIILGRRQHAEGALVMEDLGGGRFFKATSLEVDSFALELMVSAAARFSGSSVSLVKTRNVQKSFQYVLSSMSSGILKFIKLHTFSRGTVRKVARQWGGSSLSCLQDQDMMEALECLEARYPLIRRKAAKFPVKVSW
jgi:hypothetical protein